MGRILIADDHDALRRGLARALTAANHEVEEAPNGNQAIERLHEGHFDVVLSDLKMGGSDGLDVLRTARALQPTTAVVLMTAFGTVHTAVEAMKIGAFDYVQKPFEIEEMELKIEKALEHRRLRHEIEDREELRPCVGDWVAASVPAGESGADRGVGDGRVAGGSVAGGTITGGGVARIHSVLPRRSRFSRRDPGVKTREQVVAHYCDRMGFSMTPDQWRFYEVFGLFRLAVIAQQIYYRYFHRQTRNPAFRHLWIMVHWLHRRAGFVPEKVESRGGFPVGVEPEREYVAEERPFPPGCRVILFSDGVLEQQSPESEEFGIERIVETLSAADATDAEVTGLFAAVRQFAGTDNLSDDVTVASIENRGPQ